MYKTKCKGIYGTRRKVSTQLSRLAIKRSWIAIQLACTRYANMNSAYSLFYKHVLTFFNLISLVTAVICSHFRLLVEECHQTCWHSGQLLPVLTVAGHQGHSSGSISAGVLRVIGRRHLVLRSSSSILLSPNNMLHFSHSSTCHRWRRMFGFCQHLIKKHRVK